MVFRELRVEELIVRKHIHTACLFVLALVASGATLVHLRSVRVLPIDHSLFVLQLFE